MPIGGVNEKGKVVAKEDRVGWSVPNLSGNPSYGTAKGMSGVRPVVIMDAYKIEPVNLKLRAEHSEPSDIGDDGIAKNQGDNYVQLIWTNSNPQRIGVYALQQKSELDYGFCYIGSTANTRADAHTAEDLAAPDVPTVTITGKDITVTTQDNGTTYEFYVLGKDKNTGMVFRSNTEKQPVTTGVKGYVWKLSKYPQMTSEELGNTITDFPTKADIRFKGKYLHIKAVDWAGNESPVASVYVDLEINPRIELTSNYKGPSEPGVNSISKIAGMNYVPLSWTNSEKYAGWSYRLYQKGSSDAEFTTVSVKYNKKVKVLNIYPADGMNQLKTWMQNYGKNLIQVDEVKLSTFNAEPDKYLKDIDGNYKYDVLMFGSCDKNGSAGSAGDLSTSSVKETEEFIKTGRGVLFGHDTICLDGGAYHPNFASLASYLKITLSR